VDLGLTGRACVVTGAGRGIGLATAIALCTEGASALLVARSASALEAAAERCRAQGSEVATLAQDVTSPAAGERILAAARATVGEPDVLVNNAGTARWRDLDDVPDEDWQAAWDVNVMAPQRLMSALVPGMRARGWGRVVNVSSSAGKRPSANMPEYSVAKAAQLSLSRLWAERCAADGVLVNAVCPGPTGSELWLGKGGLAEQSARLSGLSDAREAVAKAAAARPIGRMAEVDEIAAAIAFLCSERASYVAGAAWSVDGGTVQVII
jgi:3-oxoacyl-[acyl-carrier protein] reductase